MYYFKISIAYIYLECLPLINSGTNKRNIYFQIVILLLKKNSNSHVETTNYINAKQHILYNNNAYISSNVVLPILSFSQLSCNETVKGRLDKCCYSRRQIKIFTSISGLSLGFSFCICPSRAYRSWLNSGSVSVSIVYSSAAVKVAPKEYRWACRN